MAAGDYRVIIDEINGSSSGASYRYSIKFKPSKETYSANNNEIVLASGPITFGKEITGHHAVNDNMDIYRMVVKKSGRVSVKFVAAPAISDITVMDGQGNTIQSNIVAKDDSEGFTYAIDLAPWTYYLKFTQVSSGKYKVDRGFEYEDYGEYKFTVNFNNAKETYSYDNNSIASVKGKTAVPLGKTIKGQLASNDEYDYYKIYIPKTGDYRITVNEDSNFYTHGHPFDLNSLLKADGTSIRSDESNTDVYDPPQMTWSYNNLKKGTYYLRFYDEEEFGKVSGPYSFVVKPAPVYSYKPDAGKKSFTARWEKGTGSGYQIQYALNKKFTKSVKSAFSTSKPKGTVVTKAFKKLNAKTTYYVRVRSYVSYKGKKYYSDWSDTVKVKTKK